MTQLRIVDAQVHVWMKGEATGHHRRAPITGAVLLEEMHTAGVDQALLVPPLWDPGGNKYALELSAKHPERFAVMGILPGLSSMPPEWGHALLQSWRELPGIVGVRLLFNEPARIAPLLAGELNWVWPAIEDAGLVTALLVPGALAEAGAIAQRYPAITFIIDHLGVKRGASGPSAFAHLPELLALAKLPNVIVKAVGVGDYAFDPYPFSSLNETLLRVLDAFGTDRVLWGSDLSRLKHDYRQCVLHFLEALPKLSVNERAAVLGGNLLRVIRWPAANQIGRSPGFAV